MLIEEANRIKNISEYYFVHKLREVRRMSEREGVSVLNFGIGSPDQDVSPEVISALNAAVEKKHASQYQPYVGIKPLREAFAKWYKDHFNTILDADKEVLPLIGSKEGIMHISMAFLNLNDEVLIPNPGYPTYGNCAKIAGATVRSYDLKPSLNWKPDLDELAQSDLSKTKLMWVNYPNMPTGATVDIKFFEALVEFGKRHEILICHDNPYSLLSNNKPVSILEVKDALPWALELTSLSKNYNMAGWRMGALLAHSDVINAVLKFKSNMDSGMFKPIQEAAITALSLDDLWTSSLHKVYDERRKLAVELLKELGCQIEETSTGMFLWAKVESNTSGEEFSDLILAKYRIFITPGMIFGSNGFNYIRLSLCSPLSDFKEAIARVKNGNKVV